MRRISYVLLCVALALAVGTGCGDDSSSSSSSSAQKTTTEAAKRVPVPASMRTVESASEDIIDLALAGKRAQVVQKAKRLDAAARGPAGADFAKVDAQNAATALRERSARVLKLAPSAPLLDVAIASNQAFQVVAGFPQYATDIPSTVGLLDYLEFQAKLMSKAHKLVELERAVISVRRNWRTLRGDVPDEAAVRHFDAHVAALARLGANTNPQQTQREAQHGLDLVDELEQSFQ
jgi:hypothetical protein